jgi:hypothetical protein
MYYGIALPMLKAFWSPYTSYFTLIQLTHSIQSIYLLNTRVESLGPKSSTGIYQCWPVLWVCWEPAVPGFSFSFFQKLKNFQLQSIEKISESPSSLILVLWYFQNQFQFQFFEKKIQRIGNSHQRTGKEPEIKVGSLTQ